MKGGRRPLAAAISLAAGVAAVSVAVGLLTRVPAPHPRPQPSGAPQPASPPPRDGGALAYDPMTQSLVLYGGLTFSSTGQTALGDTWSWDGSRWTELHPETSPPPLTAALMAYDPATGVIVLTGGETTHISGTEVSPNQTTWTWNGRDWMALPNAPAPPSSGLAALADDGATGQLILVTSAAGCRTTATWLWRSNAWEEVHPAVSPAPGHIDGLAFDTAGGRLLLLMDAHACSGGSGASTAWTWDGTTWKELAEPPPTSGSLLSTYTTPLLVGSGKTYALADGGLGGSTAWIPVGASPGVIDAAGAFDAADRETVLFSGVCTDCAGGGLSDDTWTYPAVPGHPTTGYWSLQQGPPPPSPTGSPQPGAS